MAIALLAAMTISLRNLSWALAIFFCAYAGNAAAGQLDLVVSGRSYHVNSEYDWNENNYGLGLEYQFDSSSRWLWSVNANAFMDSGEHVVYGWWRLEETPVSVGACCRFLFRCRVERVRDVSGRLQ
jgi:hypothetical protein